MVILAPGLSFSFLFLSLSTTTLVLPVARDRQQTCNVSLSLCWWPPISLCCQDYSSMRLVGATNHCIKRIPNEGRRGISVQDEEGSFILLAQGKTWFMCQLQQLRPSGFSSFVPLPRVRGRTIKGLSLSLSLSPARLSH